MNNPPYRKLSKAEIKIRGRSIWNNYSSIREAVSTYGSVVLILVGIIFLVKGIVGIITDILVFIGIHRYHLINLGITYIIVRFLPFML